MLYYDEKGVSQTDWSRSMLGTGLHNAKIRSGPQKLAGEVLGHAFMTRRNNRSNSVSDQFISCSQQECHTDVDVW